MRVSTRAHTQLISFSTDTCCGRSRRHKPDLLAWRAHSSVARPPLVTSADFPILHIAHITGALHSAQTAPLERNLLLSAVVRYETIQQS